MNNTQTTCTLFVRCFQLSSPHFRHSSLVALSLNLLTTFRFLPPSPLNCRRCHQTLFFIFLLKDLSCFNVYFLLFLPLFRFFFVSISWFYYFLFLFSFLSLPISFVTFSLHSWFLSVHFSFFPFFLSFLSYCFLYSVLYFLYLPSSFVFFFSSLSNSASANLSNRNRTST